MVKVDFYLDPEYFQEYYDYYQTIDWRAYQKKNNLPTHFPVFKFKEVFVIDNKRVKLVVYLFSETKDKWEYNVGIKVNKNEYIQKYNFFKHLTLKDVVEDINKTFEKELCENCLDYEYVVKEKNLCINCIDKPYTLKLDRCPICLEQIENNGFITDCNHMFHKQCLQQLNVCPLCRNII